MLILGAHMSIAGGFAQAAVATAKDLGGNAMQIFTKSPRGRFIKPVDWEDARIFKDECKSNGIKYIIAHSSYLLNFGKPISQVQWALKDIMTDFERLNELGGNGVVVHIGKSLDGDRKEAIKNVIENAKIVIEKTAKFKNENAPAGLEYILENTAGQGSEIGFRLEELGEIWKGLHGFSPRLKSCLDTAHIWAAGYDISTAESVQEVLAEYDQLIGLKTLSCFHFNDSKKDLGSRVDRHDNIGCGHIGSGIFGLQGLMEIAGFAEQKSIPLILETPDGEAMGRARRQLKFWSHEPQTEGAESIKKDGKTHKDDIEIVRKNLLVLQN